ncbi:hypothetical protein Hs30E_19950 [Lactococcus hodotermopsidis]|uniref:Serine protease n=1 Tax=Pseudolactococcus hodotermopsidis TaxID=2709157 RepID=A0A6A0BG16_9LACT|nr:trypsin-like peptidase domain-containing protein [Lactococcus hodotermopsidis]GFH43444.1 hypothetical protein Hs30E_19950 [Lactococcus hodotermopsidis]
MKLNKKFFILLTIGLITTTFQTTHAEEYPEILPPSQNTITIGENDSETAVSGITAYNLDTEDEELVPLPKSSRTQFPSAEGFVPNNIPLEKEARKIIGWDNRYRVTNTTSFPNSAIGKIEITFPDNKVYIGTAWMYGNKVAVTAGHCLYSKANGGWAKQVAFFPGKNGSSNPLGVYYATNLYTDTQYVKYEDQNYDWGMLRFGTNVGYNTGYFGALTTDYSQIGSYVTVRGYPGDKPSGQLWTMSGSIIGNSLGSSKLNYQMDTYGGQSGSPVYNNSYQAVAIHTNSGGLAQYNQGERIDRSLFDIITDARKW